VEADEPEPQQQGCHTNYRITIETEQSVKVVNRWRHINRALRRRKRTHTDLLTGFKKGGSEPFLHCNKRLAIFPSPAGMSLTKISLAGNN
jgi:hypothetical protein